MIERDEEEEGAKSELHLRIARGESREYFGISFTARVHVRN